MASDMARQIAAAAGRDARARNRKLQTSGSRTADPAGDHHDRAWSHHAAGHHDQVIIEEHPEIYIG